MTKAQANALMGALESHAIAASAVMSFPGGVETWRVELDPTVVYTGSQLDALAQYCSSNGLSLTAQFATLGIV